MASAVTVCVSALTVERDAKHTLVYHHLMPTEIRAVFPSDAAARTAADRLAAAGVDASAVSLVGPGVNREGSFITRLVFTIAFWSIIGAPIGVGLGTLLWLILGPQGTAGFMIQSVVWGIFGHLIAGMWAGYILLADRTQPDLAHDRASAVALLTIRCPYDEAARLAREIVNASGGEVDQTPVLHP
jgi:hypothetical protein